MSRIWSRALVEIDLLIWKKKTKPIRCAPCPKPEKVALFCDLLAMYSIAKVEALFASALAQLGCRAVVLLQKKSTLIERAFSACGSVEFIYLDELLTPEILAESRSEADVLLADAKDPDVLAKMEINGFRTGRNVLSRVVRKFRVGCLDPSSAEQMDELHHVLAESLATNRIASRLLENLKPDLAVFLEKGYTPAGEIYDACLLGGVDTIQWLGAPQSDHLLFKRYSLATRSDHPFALGDDTWEQLQLAQWSTKHDQLVVDRIASHYRSGAWFNRQQLQSGKRFMHKTEVRSNLGLRPDRKVAVIFAHILYDATFFYGESIYPNYEKWLIETVRGAIANPELDWVVKVHPVNVWRSRMDDMPMEQIEAQVLQREFGELPAHVSLMPADTDINTYSLFNAIDFGLTVRGTIGMELPCFGVPVVTAGTGRFSGHGFTIDPTSRDDYQKILSRLHEKPKLNDVQTCLARRYAFGAFFLRPYPTISFRLDFHARSFGVAALKQNVVLDLELIAEWPRTFDLLQIAAWAGESRSTDLLSPNYPQVSAAVPSSMAGSTLSPAQQDIFDLTLNGRALQENKCSLTLGMFWLIEDGIVRFRRDDGYNSSFAKQWKAFQITQYDDYNKTSITRDRYLKETGWPDFGLGGELILEAGCGAGRFTRLLAATGAKLLSFDYSSAVEVSREQNGHFTNIAFAQADILDMPFADNSFDRVFCHGVIQHTPDPAAAFRALNRVLKSGGKLSFDVYHRDGRIRPWKSKYIWRPITTRMDPDRLMAFLEWFIPLWLPIDTLIKRIPILGNYLGAVVPCWNYFYTDLSKAEQVRWGIMDTFDALAPAFDLPASRDEVVAWFKAAGYVNFEVHEGGTGLVGNGIKP